MSVESVTINITLENEIIKDITFSGQSDNTTSKGYQDIFSSNYKNLVVGKKVSDLYISRVSGSSLTPGGFNAALEQVKNSARI